MMTCRSCHYSGERPDGTLHCWQKGFEAVVPCKDFVYAPGTDEREAVAALQAMALANPAPKRVRRHHVYRQVVR